MGWFYFIIIVVIAATVGSGKAKANFAGERLCTSCHKRLKYAGAGHYATVCPRCGRTQPRAES